MHPPAMACSQMKVENDIKVVIYQHLIWVKRLSYKGYGTLDKRIENPRVGGSIPSLGTIPPMTAALISFKAGGG
jgi:hypothetical protein